jgi:hypothetical protein
MDNTVFATCQSLMHRKSKNYCFKIQFKVFRYNIIYQSVKEDQSLLWKIRNEINQIVVKSWTIFDNDSHILGN